MNETDIRRCLAAWLSGFGYPLWAEEDAPPGVTAPYLLYSLQLRAEEPSALTLTLWAEDSGLQAATSLLRPLLLQLRSGLLLRRENGCVALWEEGSGCVRDSLRPSLLGAQLRLRLRAYGFGEVL